MRKTIAKITHSGVILPALELLEILGKKGLKIALMKMTVKEVPAAGRQAFMALKELRAYILNDAEKTITITRPMADYFLNNVSVPDGLPLFTEIINDIREPDKVEFEGGGVELYDYQQTALDYILEAFNKGPFAGAFYLQMDTGLGKTRLGVGVIETLSVKTLIIVPTKAIAAQWVAELKQEAVSEDISPTLFDKNSVNSRHKRDTSVGLWHYESRGCSLILTTLANDTGNNNSWVRQATSIGSFHLQQLFVRHCAFKLFFRNQRAG
jgi:hypothetical protein